MAYISCRSAYAKEDRPNILLFTIDACRPEHFGCYGYSRKLTPNIDSLAEKGVLFTNAFSQSAWTTPGVISIFTSLYPFTHRVETRGDSLNTKVVTLPEVLKENGYAVPVLPRFVDIPNYWNLGFDAEEKGKFRGKEGEDLLKLLHAYKENQPFFIWYHYHGLHLPYDSSDLHSCVIAEDEGKQPVVESEGISLIKTKSVIKHDYVVFTDEDKSCAVKLYDSQLLPLDDYVERLVRKLKEWKLYDNTIIIITSDHGEELFEHGFVGHASTSLKAKLYEEIIRIPLIILWPKKIKHKRIDAHVQQVDIMPTVLDMLDIPVKNKLEGRSLLPLIENNQDAQSAAIYCETIMGGYQSTEELRKIRLRCIRTERWKLIVKNANDYDTYALYDLKNDPGEKENVVKKYPDIAADLQKKLFAKIGYNKLPETGVMKK
ncbi:MAG: sulfatase-like hydrolase/transferase [Candidatus Kuenenia sp.]|nr:sulfatase-like hydrolase/transferase [Candidatus Kuenenia hertensis]